MDRLSPPLEGLVEPRRQILEVAPPVPPDWDPRSAPEPVARDIVRHGER